MTAPVCSVSDLTLMVHDALAARPELEDVLVEGEVSNLKAHVSGHLYFTLKDAHSAISCVCFRTNALRIPFRPDNGMTVVAHGSVQVYGQQGRYQLYVDRLEPSGVGALALGVEQLKQRLSAEGLFDERRKRRLPLLPRRVVVVTSRSGAALRDVCTVIARRAPCIGVVLSPATVQGDGAVETLIRALQRADQVRDADVILLVRGGGSLEDLIAFNSESLARAIRATRLPVVTGVGHETDTTVADLAADRRAPTPSAAAELVAPSVTALREDVAARHARLALALVGLVGIHRQRVHIATLRLRQALTHETSLKRRALSARAVALCRGAPVATSRARANSPRANCRASPGHDRPGRGSSPRGTDDADGAARCALTHAHARAWVLDHLRCAMGGSSPTPARSRRVRACAPSFVTGASRASSIGWTPAPRLRTNRCTMQHRRRTTDDHRPHGGRHHGLYVRGCPCRARHR